MYCCVKSFWTRSRNMAAILSATGKRIPFQRSSKWTEIFNLSNWMQKKSECEFSSLFRFDNSMNINYDGWHFRLCSTILKPSSEQKKTLTHSNTQICHCKYFRCEKCKIINSLETYLWVKWNETKLLNGIWNASVVGRVYLWEYIPEQMSMYIDSDEWILWLLWLIWMHDERLWIGRW